MILDLVSRLTSAMIWPLVIGGLLLLLAGARRKVVVFYDNEDFGIGMAVIGLPIVWLLLLLGFMPHDPSVFNYVVASVTGLAVLAVSLYCAYQTFNNAVKYNRSLALGILVGVYKILFVTLVIWLAFGAAYRLLEKKNASTRDFLIASILMFIAGLATKCMINGESVYKAKGWKLSDANETKDAGMAWSKIDQQT